ncbi:putative ABC transporter ATP-binding protein [Carbonactinospora thermoautotrophica]|uniref:Putative ABC transporter ATP-binding protein n=1 Tax=Carbonactinospora thermoautotrophica TaxID=1469144 RepID=A0A132MSP6_9ACTN|nr:ABC transporter ATP-binding protein [Carbonactinospora thermoautotrophica]KWX00873.1 putative ABC transporter ATP-binding protein [Carbonactinospora thermoautotrophica]
MADIVNLAAVTVVRDGKPLLDSVDWTVRQGERWVVLGPNGAGKTTLLRVAATTIHPSSGSAAVLGQLLGRVDVFTLRPRIGLASVAVADQLPRHEPVRDVVMTALHAVVGRWREPYDTADEQRAAYLLDQLGVGALHDRHFGSLSEGERKRVLIARALMAEPELLLLDEPAAGLDLGGREELVHRLGMLARDPLSPATVLVTHHVEEIPEGFTHALMLRHGRVVAAGPIEQTLTAANLSACFGLPLEVHRERGRWTARTVAIGAHKRLVDAGEPTR